MKGNLWCIPVFKIVEDRSPNVSKGVLARIPVFKKVEDRSSIVSEVKISACTGLQEC